MRELKKFYKKYSILRYLDHYLRTYYINNRNYRKRNMEQIKSPNLLHQFNLDQNIDLPHR